MAAAAAEVKGRAKGRKAPPDRPPGGARRGIALAFLAPAIVLLGALVLYPTIDTAFQSVQVDEGSYFWTRAFVGLENYREMLDTERIRTAIKNNAIWVATAPAIITGLGLMFAILTERVRYATAIKIVVFMPMAISFLATGVIWRLMYEAERERGLMNAAIATVTDAVDPPGRYPTATVPPDTPLTQTKSGAVATADTFQPGEVARVGLTAISPDDVPQEAEQAAEPAVPSDGIGAVVWRDFKPGGGKTGVVEADEFGLPGATVEVLDTGGRVVATGESGADGSVVFSDLQGGGPFKIQLAASNFSTGFEGVTWLGSSLITPAIIGAFCWMWAGFAVVVMGAGLAALPRDVLEAARVDGASEWQTFRHVTLPLLAPVIGVVFVTMIINVLKIFDIVFVMAPGDVQDEANVIGVEMYRSAFSARDFGVGSAVAVLLFTFVIPVMVLNIRRFRREG